MEQKKGVSVLVSRSRDLVALVNQFDGVRNNQLPGNERSRECDRIMQATLAHHETGLSRSELLSQLPTLLAGTQGDCMAALTFIIKNASGVPLIDKVLEKLLLLLQSEPLYIQNLARQAVMEEILHGHLSPTQTGEVHQAALRVEKMAEDGDHNKRQLWCGQLLPILERRVEGPTKSQVLGCIIGQCAGDALGFPVEGQGRAHTTEYSKQFMRSCKPPIEARGGYLYGQYTDDSQLAREFLISIVDNNGNFVPQDYAEHIASMFVPPNYKIVGYGAATERASLMINQGVPWRKSGVVGANGNGSCMKAGPIGVTFARAEWETLRRVAVDQAFITHASSSCAGAAVAIASAARLALEPGSISIDRFLENISWMVRPVDAQVANKIEELKGWISLPIDQALPLVVQAGVACGDNTWANGAVISAGAVEAMLWALYAFLNNQNDYVGCVATAIEGGGDTDTTAAMAGSLCGAHVGLEGIPTAFTEKLNDKGEWKLEELLNLGNEVHSLILHNLPGYE